MMILRNLSPMSNKIKSIVCIYTEGATDKVFYDRLLDFIKTKSINNKFIVDEIKKFNIAGIANFKKKLLSKFKKEINIKKFKNYKKIVVLCYDEDVFNLINQTPPVDRKQLEKELKANGADEVIHLVAKNSIEDIFLIDIDNIIKELKIQNCNTSKLTGSGYQRLKTLYGKVNKIYYKGANVEPFVNKLNIGKICNSQCEIYCKLCLVLLGDKGCKK